MKNNNWLKCLIIIVFIIAITVVSLTGFKIGIYRVNPLTSLLVKGLDLSGGVEAVYTVDVSDNDIAMNDAVMNIMQKQYSRIRAYGYKDARVTKASENSIAIEVPDVSDTEELLSVVAQEGNLTFRFATGEVAIEGGHITYAVAGRTDDNTPAVTFALDEEGTKLFAEITREHINENLSIYLDDKELASPKITKAVTDGTVTITNVGTIETAERLAGLISSGKLDGKLELVSQRTIDPKISYEKLIISLICFAVVYILSLIYLVFKYHADSLPAITAVILNTFLISLLILTANWTVFTISVLYACAFSHLLFILLVENVYNAVSTNKTYQYSSIIQLIWKKVVSLSFALIIAGLVAQLISVTEIESVGQILIYEGASIILLVLGILPLLMNLKADSSKKQKIIAYSIKPDFLNKEFHVTLNKKIIYILGSVLLVCGIICAIVFDQFEYIGIRNLMFYSLTIVTVLAYFFINIYLSNRVKNSIKLLIPFSVFLVSVISGFLILTRNIGPAFYAFLLYDTVSLLFVALCTFYKWHKGLLLTVSLGIILNLVLFIFVPEYLFVAIANVFTVFCLSFYTLASE